MGVYLKHKRLVHSDSLRKSVQYSVPFIQTNLGKITSRARDANRWDRDVSLQRPRHCNFLSSESDVGASQDVESETTSLLWANSSTVIIFSAVHLVLPFFHSIVLISRCFFTRGLIDICVFVETNKAVWTDDRKTDEDTVWGWHGGVWPPSQVCCCSALSHCGQTIHKRSYDNMYDISWKKILWSIHKTLATYLMTKSYDYLLVGLWSYDILTYVLGHVLGHILR